MATQSEARRSEERFVGDLRWELVQRIVTSGLLQRATRLKAFLIHASEHALLHPGEALTEHQIGCAVFERDQTYSPADDNIVRVHARQLRQRLDEYFHTEGREEAIVLEIPKGSYVPVFRNREDYPVAVPREGGWNRLHSVLAAVILVLGVGCCLLWRESRFAAPEASWILASIFTPGQSTRVVVPDSSFGLLQGFLGRNVPLEDYLKPGYPDSLGWPVEKGQDYVDRAKASVSRPYTTFADTVTASRIGAEAERHRWQPKFSFPRDLMARDLGTGNVILLGSPKSNPWASLFEANMNFQSFFSHERNLGGIVNRSPRVGEEKEYVRVTKNGYPGEAYALIGLHVSAGNRVLTLSGTNMEGTEAAFEFAASPAQSRELLGQLGLREAPVGAYALEVVLRTYAIAGTARDTRVLAVRYRAE
ncbi:helix-turn-helix domain-containing protein [Bryobacter aggregatus]|uniref:helix-turn-helix domain-containing protein n=1 Tax=Bryobacter aggregatus TaxID=360054 RepID=UPI0004E25634|nr:helix-turn-helix domain-containing protein [Bryobacter aggregatus]